MKRVELGRRAEQEAVHHLEGKGWTILARNARHGHHEVDIVAYRPPIVAFVEVKCRSSSRYGDPLEAITRRKRQGLTKVARAWLREGRIPPGCRPRFDAVAVRWVPGERPKIRHIPDAWRVE